MEMTEAMQQELAVEEIVKGIGREAVVEDHLDYEAVVVDVIIRKT